MTICRLRQSLRERLQTSGVPDAEISVDAILEHVLQTRPGSLPRFLNDELPDTHKKSLESLIRRREKREPLQYILAQWGFFEFDLHVGPGALIPRPETEDWLTVMFSILRNQPWQDTWRFADIGTGTGAIGLTLARRFPKARGLLIDLSPEALAVAVQNLRLYPEEALHLQLCQGNLASFCSRGSLNLVISNPPYIDHGEMPDLMPEVRDYEPHLALDGGLEGLEIIAQLIVEALRVLRPGGLLAIEHGHGQRQKICDLPAPGLEVMQTITDAGNRERAIVWKKAAQV